jgi:repressor LexA
MNLTPKQLAIVEFLVAYRDEHGLSPTLEEIAQHLGVTKITIYEHVTQLCKKGALNKKPYQSRSLTVHPELISEVRGRVGSRVSGDAEIEEGAHPVLPLLGRIAAGQPIEAVEDPEESLDLSEMVRLDRASYALKVRGDSMIDDGIHDGDFVIIENRNWATNGEMVVAIVGDNEATLKRFYKNGSETVRLQPANERMAPIEVSDCQIRGVVVGVLRKY